MRRRLFKFRAALSRLLSMGQQRRRAFLVIKCGALALLCIAVAIAWTRRKHELYGLSLGTWREWSLTVSARTAGIVFEAHAGEEDWPGRRAGLFTFPVGDGHWEIIDGCAQNVGYAPDAPPDEDRITRKPMAGRRFLGFRVGSMTTKYGTSVHDDRYPAGEKRKRVVRTVRSAWAVVPYWFIATVVTAISLQRLSRFRRTRRRVSRGECAACGYDLRGCTGGRCSECGARSLESLAPGARWAWPAGAPYLLTVIVVLPVTAIASQRWNNIRCAMPANLPEWTMYLEFAPEWGGASGTGANRMLRTELGGKPLSQAWYQAVWQSGSDEFLVVVRYGYGTHAGDAYRIYVFDRRLSLVRQGSIITTCPVTVYGVYEVRSDDAAFPEAYRGKWCLGIGVRPYGWPIVDGLPLRDLSNSERAWDEESLEQDRKKLEQLGGQGYNPVYIQPVDWDDVAKKDEWWQIHLEDVKQEFRFAESAAGASSK